MKEFERQQIATSPSNHDDGICIITVDPVPWGGMMIIGREKEVESDSDEAEVHDHKMFHTSR